MRTARIFDVVRIVNDNGFLRWYGDAAARDAVYANRARLKSGVGQDALRRRGEMVERSTPTAVAQVP